METNDPLLKLYKNASFVDLYGGSILFTFVCSTLVFGSIIVAISNYIIDNTEKDWKSKRCQPPYNLLAGFIDKDKNKSFYQKTRENQEYCMKQVSSSSIQSIERPLKKAAQSIEVNQIKLNQNQTIQAELFLELFFIVERCFIGPLDLRLCLQVLFCLAARTSFLRSIIRLPRTIGSFSLT